MKVAFAGGAYQGVSPVANAQRCVNFYVENDVNELDDQGNPKKLLIGTPGLNLVATTPIAGICRGIYVMGTHFFAVMGNNLYEITNIASSPTYNLRGTLTNLGTTVPVYMADNGVSDGQQLMITDGTNGYIYNTNTLAFTKITDAAFTASAGPVVMINNWFICATAGGSDIFQLSKLGNGKTWTPLQEAEAEVQFDGITGLAADGQNLIVLGSKTLEVWWNTGAANFPFQRLPNMIFYVGCLAPGTVVRHAGAITWLGQDINGNCQVLRLDNGVPVVISTPDIEWQIRAFAATVDNLNSSLSYAYHDRGHDFYVMTLAPDLSVGNAGITLVYDITTKEWHQRSSGNPTGSGPATVYRRHQSSGYAFYQGRHYVGDFAVTGNVFEMTPVAFSDNGTTIVRDRVGIHFNKDEERITFSRAGAVFGGNSAGPSTIGANATLAWSKNRGYTYSTPRVADNSSGSLNYWNQLGQSRDWLFWLRITDSTQQVVWSSFTLESSED